MLGGINASHTIMTNHITLWIFEFRFVIAEKEEQIKMKLYATVYQLHSIISVGNSSLPIRPGQVTFIQGK